MKLPEQNENYCPSLFIYLFIRQLTIQSSLLGICLGQNNMLMERTWTRNIPTFFSIGVLIVFIVGIIEF